MEKFITHHWKSIQQWPRYLFLAMLWILIFILLFNNQVTPGMGEAEQATQVFSAFGFASSIVGILAFPVGIPHIVRLAMTFGVILLVYAVVLLLRSAHLFQPGSQVELAWFGLLASSLFVGFASFWLEEMDPRSFLDSTEFGLSRLIMAAIGGYGGVVMILCALRLASDTTALTKVGISSGVIPVMAAVLLPCVLLVIVSSALIIFSEFTKDPKGLFSAQLLPTLLIAFAISSAVASKLAVGLYLYCLTIGAGLMVSVLVSSWWERGIAAGLVRRGPGFIVVAFGLGMLMLGLSQCQEFMSTPSSEVASAAAVLTTFGAAITLRWWWMVFGRPHQR